MRFVWYNLVSLGDFGARNFKVELTDKYSFSLDKVSEKHIITLRQCK